MSRERTVLRGTQVSINAEGTRVTTGGSDFTVRVHFFSAESWVNLAATFPRLSHPVFQLVSGIADFSSSAIPVLNLSAGAFLGRDVR